MVQPSQSQDVPDARYAQRSSYFLRVGEGRFSPTARTGGAWTVDEQHIAPVMGLIAHEVERFVGARGEDGLQIARLSADILGVIGMDEFDVNTSVVRPGRTIELLEVVVVSRGWVAVRAQVWRLATGDTTSMSGGSPRPLPRPEECEPWPLTEVWPGGFIASLHARRSREWEPGRAEVWLRSDVALVAEESSSPLSRLLGLVDTANGIAVRAHPTECLFPNLDLTVHLYRRPTGDWLGLRTTVTFGTDGIGLTSTELHDVEGPVGRAAQILTVRPLLPR